MCSMRENKIEPKRVQFIQPDLNTKPTHILVEGVYGGNKHMTVLETLTVENQEKLKKWKMTILHLLLLVECDKLWIVKKGGF